MTDLYRIEGRLCIVDQIRAASPPSARNKRFNCDNVTQTPEMDEWRATMHALNRDKAVFKQKQDKLYHNTSCKMCYRIIGCRNIGVLQLQLTYYQARYRAHTIIICDVCHGALQYYRNIDATNTSYLYTIRSEISGQARGCIIFFNNTLFFPIENCRAILYLYEAPTVSVYSIIQQQLLNSALHKAIYTAIYKLIDTIIVGDIAALIMRIMLYI